MHTGRGSLPAQKLHLSSWVALGVLLGTAGAGKPGLNPTWKAGIAHSTPVLRFFFFFLGEGGWGGKGWGTSFGAEELDLSRAQGQASLATSSFERSSPCSQPSLEPKSLGKPCPTHPEQAGISPGVGAKPMECEKLALQSEFSGWCWHLMEFHF